MLQRTLKYFSPPLQPQPATQKLAGGFVRRISTVLFFAWLVSCQSKGSSVPPGASFLSARPSASVSPTGALTAAINPSQSPTVTAVPPTPDPREYAVAVSKADVWDAPANENSYWDLQTQLILGEKVLVLDRQGDWSQIAAVEQPSKKNPLGYPGWVRSASLAAGWPSAKQYAVVMVAPQFAAG